MATHKGDVIHYFSWILRKVQVGLSFSMRLGRTANLLLDASGRTGLSVCCLRGVSGKLDSKIRPYTSACWGIVASQARQRVSQDDALFSRGQALPGYSPDFNANEANWGCVRESLSS